MRQVSKSDRKIFHKIVDSQTTAAAVVVDTNDVVWNDMRMDAEMECRKVGVAPRP